MSGSGANLAQGIALQRQGRSAEAEALFRQVISNEPRNGDALHLLGMTLAGMGRLGEAVRFLGKAAEIQPSNPVTQANYANALREDGQYLRAAEAFGLAVALNPDFVVAHRGRGMSLLLSGKAESARASFAEAVKWAPKDPYAHNDLGVALEYLDRHEDSLRCFIRAATLDPRSVEAHHNQGRSYLRLGRPLEALASLDRALELSPDVFDLHLRRGIALATLERHVEAVASFDRAVALNSSSVEALNNRGVALGRILRPDEAFESFMAATRLNPQFADAYSNAATALKNLKRFAESIDYFDHALKLRPGDPVISWGKALVKLSLGDFKEGWELYESRLRIAHFTPHPRQFTVPRWSGKEELSGKTLLVHAEQGLGDTLQFCRYLALLEMNNTDVVFEVQPVLAKVLASLRVRGSQVMTGQPLRPFNFHCPLLSLPLAFGTESHNIPAHVPYVWADPEKVQSWRERLSSFPGIKVGINWQGNPETEKQNSLQGRSFALSEARRLTEIPGVQLVSLQRGAGADQLMRAAFADRIAQVIDPDKLGPDEFVESAALVSALDLVVTSDTAMAHLAGALGVPVWVVLNAVPDWRWLTEGETTPWYPTMRLFRQAKYGVWEEVFERVAAEIAALQLK